MSIGLQFIKLHIVTNKFEKTRKVDLTIFHSSNDYYERSFLIVTELVDKSMILFPSSLQTTMELETCNSHGDQENTRPNTPQQENDPSGTKKYYRQATQR